MKRSIGDKPLHVRIPADLHDTLKSVCYHHGMTAKEVIVRYLSYLQKQPVRERTLLTEKSKRQFDLQPDEQGE